jgi:dTDP-4-amino-4,6-dideoxygalactose transaminase
MKFIDLGAQQKQIHGLLQDRIGTVLQHGQYVNGPEVNELEAVLSSYAGIPHAVGCSSGTDAILMGLLAYDVKPGDLVFTTPFTFIATAEVVSLLGAVPVFVDIDPETFNIDPEKLKLVIESEANKLASTRKSRLRGVIAVDLFGLPADYSTINAIAKDNELFVIEDAAQSFGAELNGRKAGALADMACTSFFPAKPLGCYGDGGMCFTGDDEIAEALKSIRDHGSKKNSKYENARVGINGRLDTLQAAILLAKFQIFPREIELRQEKAAVYREGLSTIGKSLPLLQHIPQGSKSAWAQFSLLARDEQHRDKLQNALKEAGIPTAIYYPKPLHLQGTFLNLGYREGDFPAAESCAKRIFSIPMHPYLEIEQQNKIIDIICRCFD